MENAFEHERKMSLEEKLEEARSIRSIIHEKGMDAENRSDTVSIEFVRLEVQIAALLLGLTGFFWNIYSVTSQNSVPPISEVLHVFIKIGFAGIIFFLIGSLAAGLLHLKRVEKFWDEVALMRGLRFNKWQQAARKELSYEEARAYQEGTALDRGTMIGPPRWTWILQSVLLSISVAFLLLLSIAFVVIA